MLRKPASLVEGQAFVGTTFEKKFGNSPEATGDWYEGRISEVKDRLRGTAQEGGKLLKGLFFDIRYADGDREDLEWEDMFSGRPDIRAIKLPAAVEDHLDVFIEPGSTGSETSFKSCHSGPMSPSSPTLATHPVVQTADLPCAMRIGLGDESAHRLGGRMGGDGNGENHHPNPMRASQPQKKRAGRIRNAEVVPKPGGTDEVGDSSSGEEEEEGPPTQTAKRQRTQLLQHEHGHQSASQRPKRSFPQLPPDPMNGKAGQIKSVHAENFMCHKNFSVDFGPHLNFISGENGSGKSAALQCLQVCLGVQARLTGRAKTGKELINDNATVATAQVILWNTGAEAYQPDEYGPTITVTRKIRRSGASEYFLGEHGCKAPGRSAKKAEIDAILDHFNIDAANPIICLTQDHARAFAGSQSDEHKYGLYMKATGFEAIMQKQNASEAHIQQLGEQLQQWNELLEIKRDEMKELGKKIEEMEDVNTWQEEVTDLDRCIAWSEPLDLRAEVEQQTAAIEEQLPRDIEELKQQLEAKATEVAEIGAELAAKQEARTASTTNAASAKEEVRKLASEQRTAAKVHRAASQQAGQAIASVADKSAELVTVRESNQELQEQHIQETQAEAASHEGEVRDKQQALEQAASRASRATQALHEAEMFQQQMQQELRAKQEELSDQSKRAHRMEENIRDLQRNQGDPVLAFGGEPIKNLLHKIEAAMRQGRFSQRPIGPLGSLLSLSDDKWAVAVEAAIGRCFNDFLVANFNDLEVLRDLMRQSGIHKNRAPTVHVVTFGLPKHNLGSKPQPPMDLVTILRVLQLPEDGMVGNVVFNHLVDSQRAERRILVETEEEGLRLLRNTHKSLFRNGTISDAHDVNAWRAYTRGDSESAFRNQYPPNPRLRKDVQGHLKEMQQSLVGIQQSMQPSRVAVEIARTEAVERARHTTSDAIKLEATQKAELYNVQSQQQVPPEADISNQDEVAILDKEIRELQLVADEKARLEEQARENADAAAAAHNALKEAEASKLKAAEDATAAWDSTALRKHEVGTELRQLQDAVRDKDREAADTRLKLNAIRGALDALLTDAAEVEDSLLICSEAEAATAKQRLEELWLRTKRLRRASELPNLMKKEELELRVNKLRRDIRKQESTAGDTYEALKARQELGGKWVIINGRKLAKENEKRRNLKKSLSKRADKQAEIRDHTAQKLNSAFVNNLKKRGWVGHIEVNHESGKLVIRVKMEGAKTAAQDLKTLSGGERSFITICFLLALGKQLLAKFHCLDEFDVFMDSISQGKSMQMLMEFAAMQMDTQMILLTPQSLSAIEQAKTAALERQLDHKWPSEKFILIKCLEPAKRDEMRSTQQA